MIFQNKGSDNFLIKLIDHANVYVLYIDNHGYISMCNKKMEELSGKPRDGIIGRQWAEVLFKNNNQPLKQQMFKAVIDDSISYKRLNSFEGLFVDINNNERLISWSINPILSESKDWGGVALLEGVLFIGNDITELREKGGSLKKIDDTLKDIFTSIKEYALYVANLEGNITYYGMGSEQMFGWPKNEIIFKNVKILHLPDDRESKLPAILEQVRNVGSYESEIDLLKRDGQSIAVILTVNQFLDSHGKIIGYTFIAKDITERKKMEYQSIQTEKLVAIGQLAAGMAHEINNPLFVISGRLEMLLEQDDISEKLKDDLKIINSQADRIRKLVDRLLKFARQTPLKSENVNVNEIIESVLPFLSYHKVPISKIQIEKDMDPNMPMIKGDLNQLQEVFINLCINAIQAMPEGGKLSIKTSNYFGRFAQIVISDSGAGIAPQHLKNLFMPFFSTKKDGTGLGLSICYNIIKNHNGSIDIESQLNKGTTFIIKLPFA